MFDKKIEYFMIVAEEGSFSAAARKLLLSQSALSQQVSLLESDLSIRLFDRNGYRPTLTKKGEEFYKEVKRLSLQYQNVVAHLKEQKKS